LRTNLALALAFTKPNFLRPPPIVGGLCVLKALEPELYAKAKSGTLIYPEIAPLLGLSETPSGDPAHDEFDTRWWRFCTDPDVSNEFVQQMGSDLFRYSIRDRQSVVPLVANQVVNRLTIPT
jgi:hypothetical protein